MGIRGCKAHLAEGAHMIRKDGVHPLGLGFWCLVGDFCKAVRTSDGITQSLPGVWVLLLPTDLHFCSLFL